ncbi:hypothetical protein FNF28_01347 [Cafeteria roenbergensis]|uniref:RING-type E3 ubiquitin transferase n=1 Tax=Cafeteria roenbergensis TaxID=33653 RepID=A0A5A8DYN9_CAFRO|nr:hypothetical protein FNF28_01347 [Cafeteria roenbergensis]
MLSLFSRGRDAPQDGLSKGTTPPRQFVPKVKARKRPSLIARSMARLGLPGSGQSAEPADGALLLVTDNILVMDPRHALPVHRAFTPGVTVVDRGPEGGARILFSSNVRGRRVYASGSGPVLVPVDCLVTGLTTVRLADVASRWRDPDPDEDGPQLVMENNVVAAISVHPSTLVPRPAELALADSLAGLAGPGSDSDAGAGACTCKGAVGAAAASTAATAASSPAASGSRSGSGFEPWTASVTFDRAQCGIPAADHRFPDGFCVSLVFSSVPDAAPWKLYRSVKEGVVPPTMSVACGEAEECMVCAPYEDDTAAQHAEPAADTEAHPFEVDSRSRAGEGAAVAALAAASRRRQAGLDQELGRILAATRLAVPREVASEAQALLGTAGASDEDLILVLAVLEARGAGAAAPAGRSSEAGGSGRAGTAGAPDDDASIAARLQAAEMRESGASEAEVEQFLQGAGVAAAEAGPARRGAPPGVVSGRAPAAPSTAASAATAPAAPADSSARPPGGPTTRTRAGGATAPPGPSAYASRARSTRESARIAATVRGTVFGRASMKGASPEEVDRLAVIGITAEDLATARATEDDSVPSSDVPESVRARGRPSAACVVCCEDYEEGERVRVLPCLHRMHVRCIDPWLLIKAECPVCHESSRGGMNKDVVALVRALSDAAAEGFEGHDERVRDLLAGFLPAGMAGVDAVFRRYFAAVEAAKH